MVSTENVVVDPIDWAAELNAQIGLSAELFVGPEVCLHVNATVPP